MAGLIRLAGSANLFMTCKRGYTGRPYFGWVYGLNASNQKSLCSSDISTFWAWVYLGLNSFSRRISEIFGNWKFGRFDVDVHQMLAHQPRVPFRGRSTPKTFFSFNLSFNFVKFHLNVDRFEVKAGRV